MLCKRRSTGNQAEEKRSREKTTDFLLERRNVRAAEKRHTSKDTELTDSSSWGTFSHEVGKTKLRTPRFSSANAGCGKSESKQMKTPNVTPKASNVHTERREIELSVMCISGSLNGDLSGHQGKQMARREEEKVEEKAKIGFHDRVRRGGALLRRGGELSMSKIGGTSSTRSKGANRCGSLVSYSTLAANEQTGPRRLGPAIGQWQHFGGQRKKESSPRDWGKPSVQSNFKEGDGGGGIKSETNNIYSKIPKIFKKLRNRLNFNGKSQAWDDQKITEVRTRLFPTVSFTLRHLWMVEAVGTCPRGGTSHKDIHGGTVLVRFAN
jgi:hypothetical protein